MVNGYLEELGQALTCKYLDSCISNCLLSDILELGNGFAFKSGAYTESGRYKVLTIKNVQDGNVDCSSSNRLDELPIKMKEHCKLKPGDVVLSLTGNVGRVGIVAETSCLLNQRVAVLLPRDEHCLAGLYFIFRQQSFRSEMIGIAKGTAQANLSPVETLRLSISYDESTFQELSAILRPVFDGILANKIESLKLAEFRNLLLPKLMSGEIDVSKIGLMQLNSQFPKAWLSRCLPRCWDWIRHPELAMRVVAPVFVGGVKRSNFIVVSADVLMDMGVNLQHVVLGIHALLVGGVNGIHLCENRI